MNLKELRKSVKGISSWELKKLVEIYGWYGNGDMYKTEQKKLAVVKDELKDRNRND